MGTTTSATSFTDILRAVYSETGITSASNPSGALRVDIFPAETLGVSATFNTPLAVSATDLDVDIPDTIGVSATDLDVDIPDTIGISCGDTLGISTSDTIAVSATDLDVDIPDTIGVSATDLDIDIPDTIGVSCSDTLAVSGEVGIDPYDTLSAGMTSAVAASTAYVLPTYACNSVAVKADDDNANDIFIGSSTVTCSGGASDGWRLDAGQSISYRVSNLNKIYFTGNAIGQKIYWTIIS